MQALKFPDPKGKYQDAGGQRFRVDVGVIRVPPASPLQPVTVDSREAFLASQGLSLVPPPPPTAQQTYDVAVANGYTVPNVDPPLVLDLSKEARDQFTALDALLDKALAKGMKTPADPWQFADQSGTMHTLSIAQIQDMLLGYGLFYMGLFAALKASPASA